MDCLVLRRYIFNSPRNKLLHLLRSSSGPRTRSHTKAHRNVRVLPLRHGAITKPAPDQYSDQEHPGNLGMIYKELGNIPPTSDFFCLFSCHFFLSPCLVLKTAARLTRWLG